MNFATGAIQQSIDVQLVDDNGLPVTGRIAASFPAVFFALAGANASVSIALVDLGSITAAWSSGGLKERSGGYYRMDLPDAVQANAGEVKLIGEANGLHLICEPIVVYGVAAGATGVIAPAGPGLCNVGVQCLTQTGAARAGAVVEFRIDTTGSTGFAFPGAWATATADSNGLATCTCKVGERYAFRIDGGTPQYLVPPAPGSMLAPWDLIGHRQA
jgi:hypothetical protein